MRVSIFGSCVTRDLFEDPALRPTLVQYAARSSIVSAVADPVAVDERRVHLDSAFQRRCLLEDFNKTFFVNLEHADPDWLVVDLIDERFNLLRTPVSYLTQSSAFLNAARDDGLGIDVAELRRLTEDTMAMLDDAIPAFVERVLAVVPPGRIILHRAWWMTRYRQDDAAVAFPDERATFAERHNAALARAYATLEDELGGVAATIDLGRTRYLADAAHRWDLEPFHYEPAYNAAAVRQIRALVGR
jgi:hypothetical protein